jgi:hypothetical protein
LIQEIYPIENMLCIDNAFNLGYQIDNMEEAIRIFWHDHPDLADAWRVSFENNGLRATASDKCLCDLIRPESIQEAVAIFYPGNDDFCYAGCKWTIKRNPDTNFYAIRFNTSGWKDGIGEHKNLFYLNNAKKCRYFNENLQRFLNGEAFDLL